MKSRVFEIHGDNFHDFRGFVEEFNRGFVSEVFPNGPKWDGGLDDLDEILELPKGEEPYVIRWRNSSKSRVDLNHSAMEEHWSSLLDDCHHVLIDGLKLKIEEARRDQGMTLFDWLVDNFRQPDESGNLVELLLE